MPWEVLGASIGVTFRIKWRTSVNIIWRILQAWTNLRDSRKRAALVRKRREDRGERCAVVHVAPPPISLDYRGCPRRRPHSPRAERMKVKPPSPPSAQSVQTKKKPPGDLAISP